MIGVEASPILKINSAAVYVFTGPYVEYPHQGGIVDGGRDRRREREASRPPATSSSSFTIAEEERSPREKVGAANGVAVLLSATSPDLACESDASRTTNEPEYLPRE